MSATELWSVSPHPAPGTPRILEPHDLLRLHVQALFRLDDQGGLLRVNEADGGPAPRFFIGRHIAGVACWFRRDVERSIVQELRALAGSLPPGLPGESEPSLAASAAAILERSEPVSTSWSGPAFVVPEGVWARGTAVAISGSNAELLSPHFEDWLPDVVEGVPFVAVIESGHAASICCSVRITSEAHEAGVETAPPYRGRGYAGRAVAAWAGVVGAQGRVPLYSTSWNNPASRGVARKLGLIQYAADLHLR